MDERDSTKGARHETLLACIGPPREDGSDAGSAISLAQHCHDSGNQDQDAYKELGAGNDATIQGSPHLSFLQASLKNLV